MQHILLLQHHFPLVGVYSWMHKRHSEQFLSAASVNEQRICTWYRGLDWPFVQILVWSPPISRSLDFDEGSLSSRSSKIQGQVDSFEALHKGRKIRTYSVKKQKKKGVSKVGYRTDEWRLGIRAIVEERDAWSATGATANGHNPGSDLRRIAWLLLAWVLRNESTDRALTWADMIIYLLNERTDWSSMSCQ